MAFRSRLIIGEWRKIELSLFTSVPLVIIVLILNVKLIINVESTDMEHCVVDANIDTLRLLNKMPSK